MNHREQLFDVNPVDAASQIAGDVSLLPVHWEAEQLAVAHNLNSPLDDRARYLPFVEVLDEDPRKHELERALVGLALLSFDPETVKDKLSAGQQRLYAKGLVEFERDLRRRVGIVGADGETLALKSFYGDDITDEWREQYSQELRALWHALVNSRLYAQMRTVQARRLKDGISIEQKPNAVIRVFTDINGAFIVGWQSTKIPAQRKDAEVIPLVRRRPA